MSKCIKCQTELKPWNDFDVFYFETPEGDVCYDCHKIKDPEKAFDPLELMPSKLSQVKQKYYKKLATRAKTSPKAAIELKCLAHCCAWNMDEVKGCQAVNCPLWLVREKIFEND